MVVASLPVTSCRRTALSLAALVMVAQLTASPVLAMSVNGLESRQRLQQLLHNADGELATSLSDANIVSNQIKSNLLLQKGQLATNNANIKTVQL